MWDTVSNWADELTTAHLSHDLPCLSCGHGAHRYLPCDACECTPAAIPGLVYA